MGALAPTVTGVLAVVVPADRNVPKVSPSPAYRTFWLNVVLAFAVNAVAAATFVTAP